MRNTFINRLNNQIIIFNQARIFVFQMLKYSWLWSFCYKLDCDLKTRGAPGLAHLPYCPKQTSKVRSSFKSWLYARANYDRVTIPEPMHSRTHAFPNPCIPEPMHSRTHAFPNPCIPEPMHSRTHAFGSFLNSSFSFQTLYHYNYQYLGY